MNPIGMSTRDVRTVLREADDHETGLTVRVAVDIYGPGGSVFIAANSKLTERHLVWLTRYGLDKQGTVTYLKSGHRDVS